MEEIKVKNLQIAFRRLGSGPPLVLLHGALSDSRVWRRQMDDLSNGFDVVAWDAPGCGHSSDPPEDFLLSDYADCLSLLIEKIGIQKPHILGISFGAGLTLEFYQRYPDIPKTLILASAYAGWAGSLPPEEVKDRLQKGMEQSKLPPEKVVQAWIPTLFSKSVSTEIINETKSMMADFHPVGMRAMLRSFAQADLRDVLPKIHVPTLLLYGDHDRRSPLSVAKTLHAQIPNSKLIIMPGVGHDSNQEDPETFNREVRHFLESYQN